MDNLTWATWALAIITLLLVIWTVFGEKAYRYLRRSQLDLDILMKPPDCIEIPINKFGPTGVIIDRADSYYARFRVINNGKDPAINVEVYMLLLEKETAEGYEIVDAFIPLNLQWAVDTEESVVYYPRLTKGVPKHCNLGHIIDPQKRKKWRSAEEPASLGPEEDSTLLILETTTKPSSLSYLLPPGKFRTTVVVSADNAEAVAKHLEVSFDGKWYEDKQEMWGKGLSIRMLD